jgi:GMP synthase-like glutamine amidotransferase
MKMAIDTSPAAVLPVLTPDGEALRRRWLTSRPQVLVIHHEADAPSAHLLDLLREQNLEPKLTARAGRNELPDPEAVKLAILLGSERFQEAVEGGSLERELDWLRAAEDSGTRIIGIGHGARILALALGGDVTPADVPYRGWMMVSSSVPHVIPSGPWLAWQHDIIRVPPSAEVLAENRLGPQAFRIGRHLGVQFHPEATPQAIGELIRDSDSTGITDTVLEAMRPDPAAARVRTSRLFASFVAVA